MLILRLVVVFVVLGLARVGAAADFGLPAVFSDHMVLQRGGPVRIWGTAEAGASVRVSFGDQMVTAVAGDSGTWMVTLAPMVANDVGRALTVRCGDESRSVVDVLVGDVWLCSGQSNMEWTLRNSQDAAAFIAGADDPRIRMFFVPLTARDEPQGSVPGDWRVASPETVGDFSAVAYHFARHVMPHIDVPIGLIKSAWGGSTVEAWISRPVLDTLPDAQPFLEAYDAVHGADSADVQAFVAPDTDAAVDLSTWETFNVPGLIEAAGYNIDGRMWFRRTVEIPPEWAGRSLRLNLGLIDDFDVTYFNGVRVGATGHYQTPRVYTIDAAHVTAGEAVIAVRVEDTGYDGGFYSAPEQLQLHPADDTRGALALAGDWKLKVVAGTKSGRAQHRPANLYNGMIHPLRFLALRGAIWYQGESNAYGDRGSEYFTLFPALIHDWRERFELPELPFYFVQLPNFNHDRAGTPWRYPLLRQAQLETFRAVPGTGMAITLELGEAGDIHPRNKDDVGERLARWALTETYGVSGIVTSGPIATAARFEDDGRVRVSFDLYGSPLAVRGDGDDVTELAGFELAGDDNVFHAAAARIDGDVIVVSAPGVPQPQRLRYAWKNYAGDANLINGEGLPASPFRFERGDAQ